MVKGKSHTVKEIEPKTKLRTASEVINRLKFDECCDSSNILIGYDDRVNGPMEKSLHDFIPISQGGDIPEHRIWYFRREPTTRLSSAENDSEDESEDHDETLIDISQRLSNEMIQDLVLWDRPGRVDKIFESSGNSHKIVSEQTTINARAAIQNMARIEAEKLERRKLRDKERQRKAQRRHARNEAIALLGLGVSGNKNQCDNQDQPMYVERYTWHETESYDYIDDQWVHCCTRKVPPNQQWDQKQQVKILTWNVLFDMHSIHDDGDLSQQENHIARWKTIIEEICCSDADIIGLQEMTPIFVNILAASGQIQKFYAMTAAPGHSSTITPCGNLILWRKKMFQPISCWVCKDGNKQRSGLVALKWKSQNKIIVLANLHLLSDPAQKSAAKARQRELSSVLAQLQLLEGKLHKAQKAKDICPLVIGDFNADEQQRELEDGCFSAKALVGNRLSKGFFLDAWLQVADDDEGYTFNPQTNPKAYFTRTLTTNDFLSPKRNDRVYVVEGGSLTPTVGELLGNRGNKSPSDHFGVSITFQSKKQSPTCSGLALHDPIRLRNAWATSVEPTNDTLLGLVLSQSEMGGINLFDHESTLPLPHITMLHGFAEYGSRLGMSHAIEAVTDAVEVFLSERGDSDSFKLSFDTSCLDIFQHNSSCTLVALPDICDGSWLLHLYKCLLITFPKCHHQETRFESGWTPHVSLGSFGTSNAARSRLKEIMEGSQWISKSCRINVGAITLFQRSKIDGKIHVLASLPLIKKPPDGRKLQKPSIFLNDMGYSWTRYFRGQSEAPLLELQSLCQQTSDDLQCKLIEVVPTGSYSLGVCIPHLSDIDLVVKIHDYSGIATGDAFFERLAATLKGTHPYAKARGRTAGTTTSALSILTLKLSPWTPSIDLILCFVDENDRPNDPCSEIARNTIFDTPDILLAFSDQTRKVFQNTLRTIKLWAWREGVYGQAMGYLGGGGWGVLVARVLLDAYQKGELQPPLTEVKLDILKASREAVDYFFNKCSKSPPLYVTIGSRPQSETTQDLEKAYSRGVMAVIAPRSQGNHGRNATPSTTASTQEALSKASAANLENVFASSKDPLDDLKTSNQFSIKITVEVDAKSTKLAESKAILSSRALRLLVSLEHKYPYLSRQMRLLPSHVRKMVDSKITFSLFIGFDAQPTKVFESTLERAQMEWNEESSLMRFPYSFSVSWIRCSDL